jgi:hypothetical protein
MICFTSRSASETLFSIGYLIIKGLFDFFGGSQRKETLSHLKSRLGMRQDEMGRVVTRFCEIDSGEKTKINRR